MLKLLFIFVCLHFSFISFGRSVEFDNFYVERSGHSKVKPSEIAIVFFMTVANSGRGSKKIYSKNTKCCWRHPGSGSRYDCDSMDLVGGMPVVLEPSKTANITYLFTNLYPLDRVGQCVFHLWHMNNKVAHTIRFNTTQESREKESWFGSLYKTIAGGEKKTKICDTMDLDPRRNCKPVNCVQKYNGKRNFFRKETKLCEPVHECYTSRDEDGLPTTAFDKDHNKCKSLIQKELTKDEERDLKENVKSHMEATEKAKYKTVSSTDRIPVQCNHGKRVGEICVCDDGWKTDTSNVPLGNPKFIYNWCNVRTRKKPLLPYKQQKNFMIAGLSLTSFTLLVVWLWMIQRYVHPQPEQPHEKHHHCHMQQPKHHPDVNKHKWKKENLFATSKLLKELAQREVFRKLKVTTQDVSKTAVVKESDAAATAAEFIQDDALISVEATQSIAPMKSKTIKTGKSAVANFIKQSAKNLLSSHSMETKQSSRSASSQNNENDGSMPLVQQVSRSLAQEPSMTSDVSQESSSFSGHAKQEKDIHLSLASETVAPQRSVPLTNALSQEPATNISLSGGAVIEGKSIPLTREVSQENHTNVAPSGNAIHQQRSLSPAGPITLEKPGQAASIPDSLKNDEGRSQVWEKQISKEGSMASYVRQGDGVAKTEPSRIVASRTTRGGSIFTLAGPSQIPKHTSVTPVVEDFSDSD